MDTLSNLLHELLPLLSGVLLILGIKRTRVNYLIAALWLSLIALWLHYQAAGGEILGTYFGYKNASIYTLNLIVLISTLLCLFFKPPLLQGKISRYLTALASVALVIGSLLLLINLWINAYFIENRRLGSPILQVATFTPLKYCSSRYVFYKAGFDNQISYMCPNYYGIIPSIGDLLVSPDFLLNQLKNHPKTKIKIKNKVR